MIREARTEDVDNIWIFFKDIAQAGETYSYDRNLSKDEAFQILMRLPSKTFVLKKW